MHIDPSKVIKINSLLLWAPLCYIGLLGRYMPIPGVACGKVGQQWVKGVYEGCIARVSVGEIQGHRTRVRSGFNE